jgi:hypothetical protein
MFSFKKGFEKLTNTWVLAIKFFLKYFLKKFRDLIKEKGTWSKEHVIT